MKLVFYSEKCEYCKKLLTYLDKHNINSLFNLINIDNIEPPKEIDIVPTIIDSELSQPLKGKKVFEYLLNIKYFNNPTNNIEVVKDLPANPNIPEDNLANKESTINLEIEKQDNDAVTFYENNKDLSVSKATQEMVNQRNIQDKKLSLLLKMKRK